MLPVNFHWNMLTTLQFLQSCFTHLETCMQSRYNANSIIKFRVRSHLTSSAGVDGILKHRVVPWQRMLALLDCGTRCPKYGTYLDISDFGSWLYLTSFLLELYGMFTSLSNLDSGWGVASRVHIIYIAFRRKEIPMQACNLPKVLPRNPIFMLPIQWSQTWPLLFICHFISPTELYCYLFSLT